MGMISKLQGEFDARKVNIFGIIFSESSSLDGFIQDVQETQACAIKFPIVADVDGNVLEKVYIYIYNI